MSGSMRSSRTTSGRAARTRASASAPVGASRTWKPALSQARRVTRRKLGSSSTRRMSAPVMRWSRAGGGWGGAVEDEPVEAELADAVHELQEVDRLAHVAVGAEAVAVQEVTLFVGRGEDDDGQVLGALVGAEAAQHLQAVELGQLEVEQHHLREEVPVGGEQVVERFD